MRDRGAYGCAVPRAYANLNPGLLGSGARVSASFQKIPHIVGRLGSGVWVIASLQIQIFALTADGNVLAGEGNCPGGEYVWREYVIHSIV